MARIRDSFRDLAGLKSQFTAVASGMAGSGYVWLVADADGKMAVLPTFAAGTLLVSAREQTSPRDGANALVIGEESKVPAHGTGTPRMLGSGSQAPASPASGLVHPMSSPTAPQGSRALSTSPVVRTNGATSLFDGDNSASYVSPIFDSIRKKSNLRAMGETIYPLFCVSMHEHCWMSAGFGVWGKEAWLEHFWNVLDWEKVSRTYTGGKRK